MNIKNSTKGHVALVFFSMFVAGTYYLGSLAAPYVDAMALMALRFVFAAILMGVIVAVRHPRELAEVAGFGAICYLEPYLRSILLRCLRH